MRSSTSSFKRAVPRGTWVRSAVLAVIILVVAITAWEVRVRAEGYAPCLNDSSDLWARSRSRVSADPEQVVIVGASRAMFDIDLTTCAAALSSEKPVQLGMAGTNPLPLLEDLAENSAFCGTLIVGVAPGMWFVPEGPLVESAEQALGRFHNWSPSQKAGLVFAEVLQSRLAFINAEDLTLPTLMTRWQLPDRPGAAANQGPSLPPYFGWTGADRQANMWELCDFGTPLARRIQQIWVPLFTPPPPPPHLTPEEFEAMKVEGAQMILGRIGAAADKLRARGVRLVLVRPPSSGDLRQVEAKYSPREAFWDRMVAAAGAPGIHFEDYPELAGFECPEWSHLTTADAVRFTQVLMPHVKAALAGQGG